VQYYLLPDLSPKVSKFVAEQLPFIFMKRTEPKYDDIQLIELQNLYRYTGEKIDINSKCKNIQKIINTPVKFDTVVMWECSKEVSCTGLGDVIRNLISTFIYATDRGYLFNIMWSKTFQVYPEILLPNVYDWKNKTLVNNYTIITGDFGHCDWNKPFKYIRIGSNKQFHDDAECDNFKNKYTHDIIEYWLEGNKPQVRGCPFWTLFKFGDYLKKRLKYHEDSFSQWLSKRKYKQIISIQIRSGDDVMFRGEGLKITAAEIISLYFSCVRKLEREKGFQHSVYFLIADSIEIRQAARANKDIYSPDIVPKHVIFHQNKDVLTDFLIEVIMMAKINALVRSHSGFGISAESLGMMENVAVYPDCTGHGPEYNDYY
jgi:hypothetical protein